MSTANSLTDWFTTPQGQYLLSHEQAFFDQTVADIFGFNAVQLGLTEYEFLRASRMPLRTVAGIGPASKRANPHPVKNQGSIKKSD